MIGGSYTGYSQRITAGTAGPALKAIVPMMDPLEGYHAEPYPGGVYLWGFMTAYSEGLTMLNLNYYKLDPARMLLGERDFMLPAAPVVDEDGDGELWDEVPLDLNKNGSFLDDYLYPADLNDEPQYKDGGRREHIYYLATLDHKKNIDYHAWAQYMYFIDATPPYPLDKHTVYDFTPSVHVSSIQKKDIAIYNIGGWFDTFVRGATEWYCTMEKTNTSKLLIVPSYHGGGGPYWEYLGEDTKSLFEKGLPEIMRFFDHYLKDIDNGIDKEPPIIIYVMNGGGFRQENEWPLARQVVTEYYFNSGNGLSTSKSSSGSDKYTADFTHDARWGKSKGNRWLATMGQAPDALPIRTKLDKKCLTYTTAPLAKDTEVTGHPIVRFWVSSSADYGDFFVYLEDVDEKGEALFVSEGVLRAGFAALVDNDEMIKGGGTGIDVLPDLPWQGFESTDYVDRIFADGNVVELLFDLKPTSWVFRKGHSIRVTIACADWPTFRLHPRLAPFNDPEDPANIIPIITVYRDAKRPSGITLPVIPE
jgi:putative CocE/NonD family hydrolase